MNTGPFGLEAQIIALLEPFLKSVHDGCFHLFFSFSKKQYYYTIFDQDSFFCDEMV
jgi:hypothetical protein